MSKRHEKDPRITYNPRRVLTTAESFGRIQREIDFPRDLKGKVVLDIGSGGSDTVAQLRKRGAFAVGVDIQYGNLSTLNLHMAQQLVDPKAWIEGRKWPHLTEEEVRQVLWLDQPDTPRFARWMMGYMGDDTTRHKLTYKEFLHDTSPENTHYVAASALNLPFQDDSVDFYFSMEAITAFMLGTRSVFQKVMAHAHRVVKPGGEIQLYPWIDPNPAYWSEQQVYNGMEYMNQLRSKNIPFEVVRRGKLFLLKVHNR